MFCKQCSYEVFNKEHICCESCLEEIESEHKCSEEKLKTLKLIHDKSNKSACPYCNKWYEKDNKCNYVFCEIGCKNKFKFVLGNIGEKISRDGYFCNHDYDKKMKGNTFMMKNILLFLKTY
jgi:hypothetical protein